MQMQEKKAHQSNRHHLTCSLRSQAVQVLDARAEGNCERVLDGAQDLESLKVLDLRGSHDAQRAHRLQSLALEFVFFFSYWRKIYCRSKVKGP